MAFHEVRLPARLAFGSTGGVERRTEITTLGSGFERRSTPWAEGRRRYLIGAGLRSLDDMAALTAFFEARRGRLYGFRFRDIGTPRVQRTPCHRFRPGRAMTGCGVGAGDGAWRGRRRRADRGGAVGRWSWLGGGGDGEAALNHLSPFQRGDAWLN